LKRDPNAEPKKQDQHSDADEWLEAHGCPHFEPGRKPRPHKSGAGQVCAGDGCRTDANSDHIMGLTARKLDKMKERQRGAHQRAMIVTRQMEALLL
jgi:hypothetical protein